MILCTSSYNYPLLQQSSVCRGPHIPAHVRATAGGRALGTFGVSMEGPEWESLTDSSGTEAAEGPGQGNTSPPRNSSV